MFIQLRRALVGVFLTLGAFSGAQAATTLLNVSYDPTREFYVAYNAAFADYSKKQGGGDLDSWTQAKATHFADGGVFDEICQPGAQ